MARAVDASGTWGDWSYGKKFTLGQFEENYTTTNPAFTGVWTRSAWQPASAVTSRCPPPPGTARRSAVTGSNVAWVGTKATTRGQARVYIDGALASTVDLYAATTAAQSIAFTKSWPTAGAHTIAVEVVGTAGRPKVDVDAFVRLR